MLPIPTKFFLVSGSGEGTTPLNAFDNALISAGVGHCNLVKVSSVIPPRVKKVKIPGIPAGAILPIAYAHIFSDIPADLISSAIAVAIPEDKEKHGVIMEYSTKGSQKTAERIVVEMAEAGMKSRGLRIKKIYTISIEHEVKKIGAVFAGAGLWW